MRKTRKQRDEEKMTAAWSEDERALAATRRQLEGRATAADLRLIAQYHCVFAANVAAWKSKLARQGLPVPTCL